MQPVIIFKTDNKMSAKRLAAYLYRNGYTRATSGVHVGVTEIEDKDKFWAKVRSEFLISENDFFAFVDSRGFNMRTKIHPLPQTPSWPIDE